jgi:pyranose oxidase
MSSLRYVTPDLSQYVFLTSGYRPTSSPAVPLVLLKSSLTAASNRQHSVTISSNNPLLSARHVNHASSTLYLLTLFSVQIVLKRSIIDAIWEDPAFKERVEEHHKRHPNDPLPIPFRDPEPQVMIPYKPDTPWHVQVHRDAFSYGDVGPRADPRVVVDLRFFGKQDIVESNCVEFGGLWGSKGWEAGVTDIYGMPQATVRLIL